MTRRPSRSLATTSPLVLADHQLVQVTGGGDKTPNEEKVAR